MSPELLEHAMNEYVLALKGQVNVAKAFFSGELEKGLEGLLALPEDIRLKIDQLVWEASGGEAIDPTEEHSQKLIAAAVMHSVEERMGLLDD